MDIDLSRSKRFNVLCVVVGIFAFVVGVRGVMVSFTIVDWMNVVVGASFFVEGVVGLRRRKRDAERSRSNN